MKLFYKKDYLGLLDKLKSMQKEMQNKENNIDQLRSQVWDIGVREADLVKEKEKILAENIKLKDNYKVLTKKYKELSGANGGLKSKNNSLKAEIDDLKEEIQTLKNNVTDLKLKLEESMSDKYLVKKVPAEKARKTKKLGIKRGVTNSQVKNILKEKSDING